MNKKQLYTKNIQHAGELLFFLKVIFCLSLNYLLVKYTISASFPLCLIPQLGLGTLFLHMKELQHESLHNPIRWKFFNRCIGCLFEPAHVNFLLRLPIPSSSSP